MSSPLTIPPEIEAALVWDRPRLMRSGDPGAQAFVASLDPPPVRLEESASGPLATAAVSIVAERSGDGDAASDGFRELARSDDPFVALLGLMLRCWSSGTYEENDFDNAAANVELVSDPLLKARLFMKLATFALDKQEVDRFGGYLNAALGSAPQLTRFRRAVMVVIANYSAQWLTEPDESDDDPLVRYQWIDDLAARSARDELISLLKARAQSPWSWSVQMGRTNADVAVAAELQATWAGALWMRDGLRRQLAAQLPSPAISFLVRNPLRPLHVAN